MKIKLHYIQPNNYGNLMMVTSFIENFISNCIKLKIDMNDIEFYTDVENESELIRIKNSFNKEYKIFMETKFLNIRTKNGILGKIEKLVHLYSEIKFNINEYDYHIVLGGDCISEYYSKARFYADLLRLRGISKKRNVFLVGQTIGPFSKNNTKIVNWSLKNCILFTRDDNCYRYSEKNLKLKRIEASSDLAFLDIPFQNDDNITNNLVKKFNLPKEYITIVASGLYKNYTNDFKTYIEEYAKIIENLVNKYDNNIVLLAHTIHTENSNDSKAINEIIRILSPQTLEKVCVINELLMPYEARIILGNGKFTITGRMHAAVSSINMGVIPICLSYSVKYAGVIGDTFNLNSYIIECSSDEMWELGNVSKGVLNIVKELLENHSVEQKKLQYLLSSAQVKAMSQIETICNEIKIIRER